MLPSALETSYWVTWIQKVPTHKKILECFAISLVYPQDTFYPNTPFQGELPCIKHTWLSRSLIQGRKRAIFEALAVTGTQAGAIFLSDLWGRRTLPTESLTVQDGGKNAFMASALLISLVPRIQLLQISSSVCRIRRASHLCHVPIVFLGYCWSLENYFSAYDSWDTNLTVSLYRHHSVPNC